MALRALVIWLLFSWMTSGCGTLAGSEQAIGFDSEPRGLNLRFNDEKELYQTPSVLFRPRSFKQKFTLFNDDLEKNYATHCGPRWAESVIPNLVVTGFGLVNPAFYILGGLFFGVDTTMGTIFQCPDVIRVAVAMPIKEDTGEAVEVGAAGKEKIFVPNIPNKPCWRVILAPMKHPDPKAADLASAVWVAKMREQWQDTCHKVIEWEASRIAFRRFSIDHATGASPQKQQRSLYFDIGARTGATHIAFPFFDKERKPARIEARLYDIVAKKWENDVKMPSVYIVYQELTNSLREPSFFAKSVNYLPNALFYNVTGAKVAASPVEPAFYKITGDREEYNVPRVLTSFGVGLADNPRAHAAWDLSFQIYPSLFTHYTKRVLQFEFDGGRPQGTSPQHINYTVEYLYALPLINVGPTFHTPAGAFSFHLSGGLITLLLNDSLNNRRSRATLGLGYKASYTAFLTERMFLRFELEAYKQQTKLLDTQYIRELDAITSAFFSIGFHIPDGKDWVRNLF